MSNTDDELTELIATLLEMQAKITSLEEQQGIIKKQLAVTVAQADALRRRRNKGESPSASDTLPE